MFKIICIMATHGRPGITTETVKMLQKQTVSVEVLIVGDSGCEPKIAADTGCICLKHKNKPLGKKWQAGVNRARALAPDAVMICGSDSWLTPRWCETAIPFLKKGHDLIGINMFHACKVYPKQKVRIIRRAYQGKRIGIPMGSGRIFSKKILDALDWKIFPINQNSGMDIFSYKKVIKQKGRIRIVHSDDMKILAVKSTWKCINSWNHYIESKKNKEFTDIKEPKVWLNQNFPGSIKALTRVVDNIVW